MALFKVSKGLKANLPSAKTEGYCWYTTDDSLFYIDYKDENGSLQRKALNAKDAETLTGASLSTILNSSDVEIPTSKAVLDALNEKLDKVDAGSDWNQNDSTAADYVKNRPFYTGDPVATEIVNVSLFNFRQSGNLYAYQGTDFSGEPFEIGSTYTVTFDDSTYNCTTFLFDGLNCLGNSSIVGPTIEGSADVPFLISRNPKTSLVYTTIEGASHSLKIVGEVFEVKEIDKKYIPALDYLDKNNPTGTGTFSMNRDVNSDIGQYSVALGENCVASGDSSISVGDSTKATGITAQAFGFYTEANARFSHAEGYYSKVSTNASEKVVTYEVESGAGIYGHAEGFSTLVTGGVGAHAEGAMTLASGDSSHAEGHKTIASGENQHVQGTYNVEDPSGTYAHIVGNGTSNTARSNAHTLDWSGNAWFAGTVEGNAVILPSSTSSSTKKFKITVDDDYNVSATNTSDSVSKTLATTEYVDNSVSNPLNITSATVGQIAKISAVDDTGKPTTWEAVDMPTPFKPTGKSYLTFSSPNSFTLAVGDATKHWDGTLEYFASNKTWTTWDGPTTLSSVDDDGEYVLYLRGTGNTKIGYYDENVFDYIPWVINGTDVRCNGNIETLLDYASVVAGQPPTMAEKCFGGLFNGCKSLTQAPALPVTTLANGCYYYMFHGCTSLTKAPALPATTLANDCYYGMFSGCTSLTQAPELPATTLADYCYSYMFYGCTGLTQAPALPATTLAESCYYYMFSGCTSLTQAPELPATTLANNCYSNMFYGCTSLKLSSTQTGEYMVTYRIPSSGTGTTANNALTDMFIDTGGTFTGTPEINTTYYLSTDNMIVRETEVATLNGYVGSMIDAASVQPDWNQNDETAPDYVKNRPFYTCDPVETVLVEESTVAFALDGRAYGAKFPTSFNAEYGQTYKVSWDGAAYERTCVELAGCPVIGNLSISNAGPDTGEPFLIFNESGLKETDWISYTADTSASHTISISGFVQEVVKIDEKYLPDPFKPEGKSYLTFSSPNSFTLAVKNANKSWDGTLEYFASNKTWTTWDGTSTLSSVYNDGNNVLYLRGTGNTVITGNIFDSNWVLTGAHISCIGNIENLLDYATVTAGNHPTMASDCYQEMFRDCTALIQAPDLPATTLADSCYHGIFQGCTSLTQAPELPATTLADHCYYYMFHSCTSLTQAPVLPATTLAGWCYSSMFSGCTALTRAPALPATTLADYCYFHMFDGCTSLTRSPELPATTLSIYCYNAMFQDCTALTIAPSLPATTLADRCYYQMFYGCTSLKLSSTQTGEYIQEYRIPTTGTGATASNALTDMFTNTGGNFLGAPSINTTYYLSSDNMIVRETDVATLNGYVVSMIDAAIGNAIGGSY